MNDDLREMGIADEMGDDEHPGEEVDSGVATGAVEADDDDKDDEEISPEDEAGMRAVGGPEDREEDEE